MLDRFLHVWSRVETVIIGILVLAALFTFLGGAALRVFTPQHAVDWADEVALYFIIWGTLIAGSVLAAERRHISAEVVVATLPPGPRRIVAVGIGVLTLGFCAIVAWYGWEAYEFSRMLDDRSGSSLRTPQSWALFLPLPIGMTLLCVRIVLLAIQGRGITEVADHGPKIGDR